jgi:hypothetical protein
LCAVSAARLPARVRSALPNRVRVGAARTLGVTLIAVLAMVFVLSLSG